MNEVRGLKHFSDFFIKHKDDYVIIGGSALNIILNANDLTFRSTKDLDIVILSNNSKEFNSRLTDYIRLGMYETKETVHQKQYYRFAKPTDQSFPEIIEIFARNEGSLDLADGQYVIPIVSYEAEKLSAILLDDEYFNLIKDHRTTQYTGYSIVHPLVAICLKARAFRELSLRKLKEDTTVDARDIKKHRNDIIKLAQILGREKPILIGHQARHDLTMVIESISAMDSDTIKRMIGNLPISKEELIHAIESSFLPPTI